MNIFKTNYKTFLKGEKMDNFIFQSPTRIIFGKDTELEVGKETKKFAGKVLLQYGGSSIKNMAYMTG